MQLPLHFALRFAPPELSDGGRLCVSGVASRSFRPRPLAVMRLGTLSLGFLAQQRIKPIKEDAGLLQQLAIVSQHLA